MYAVIIIQNGTTFASATYADWNDAKARYHQELAYRHESRESTMCMIINADGQVQLREKYSKNSEE